jgi:hypothetical protein
VSEEIRGKVKLYRVETVIVSYVVAETEKDAIWIANRDAINKDPPTEQLVSLATQQEIQNDEWSDCIPWPEQGYAAPKDHTVEWYCEQMNGDKK